MQRTLLSVTSLLLMLFLLVPVESAAQSSRRGYLGIHSDKVTKKVITRQDLPVDYGAYVTSVVEGSAADDAGIKSRDVIVKVGDEVIYDPSDLTSAIRGAKPYTEVKIELYRKGEKKTLTAKVDRLKTAKIASSSFNWIDDIFSDVRRDFQPRGVKAQDITRQLGEYFGVPDGRGVLITEVRKGGVVDKSGFKAGDVVTKVYDRSTDDLGELLEAIRDRDGDTVKVEVVRDKKAVTLSLAVPSDDEDWY